MRRLLMILCVPVLADACSAAGGSSAATPAAGTAAPAKAKLGIRADGDTEIKPDLSKISNEDLKKVFTYIDDHIDDLHWQPPRLKPQRSQR